MAQVSDALRSNIELRYQYRLLEAPCSSEKQIRIVTLQQGKPDDNLQISINFHNIAGVRAPSNMSSYEALSYTWGAESQGKQRVLVNDNDNPRAYIEVYENLFDILQTLRLPHQDRRLWIDAICINQDESEEQARVEKSWQIPMMHEIYNAASRVLIWLGPEKDDSTFALAFLKVLGETFLFNYTTYQVTEARTAEGARLWNNWGMGFVHDSREHKAVLAIFARPWFTRVWIRQEAFAASDRSVVMCGSASVPLDSFRNAVQVLFIKGLDGRHPEHAKNLAQLTLATSVFQKAYMSILESLSWTREAQCRWPQDKLYGCLGMIKIAAKTGFADTISTSYPPTLTLFKEFCVQYTKFLGNIQFLYHAGLCQRSSLGGPSWMPDWTVNFTRLDLSLERAVSHAMHAEAQFVGSRVLRVKGVFAADIDRVDMLEQTENFTVENLPQAIHSLAAFILKNFQPGNTLQLEHFTRAFCSALLWMRVPMAKLDNHREDFGTFIKDIFTDGRLPDFIDVKDRDSLSVFQATIYFFQKRRIPFIFTEDGHVGVGADRAQGGDLIAAVLGLRNLVILRRSHQAHEHQYVGACFVHGFNWGEALLGALPRATLLVPRLNQSKGIYESYYSNAETGDSSFWDPRIDWAKLTPGHNEAAYTINAPDGEPRRKVPNAKYLETHHNVNILDIDLV